jgi:hypothetical protein
VSRLLFLPAVFFCFYLSSCTDPASEDSRDSCDFSICDARRNAIDTLENSYGVLHPSGGERYIEVTSVWDPHVYFISCLPPQSMLPDIGSYVRFGGLVKDPCAAEDQGQIDSLQLQEIEALAPLEREGCPDIIVGEEFDIGANDDKLRILHLRVVDGCLRALVSYTGGCSGLPVLDLVSGGDILFGGVQMVVSLQGAIDNDCAEQHYAVYTYDLSPLRDLLSAESVILWFQSQGGLRVEYTWQD